jgi:predicted ATPase/DNA-binding SARP family transcriptional activator/tetratricopeptide (TPR) repeat protein
MSMLKFALLGPPQITRADGTPVTFRSRKELALLTYLAVEHARPHRRDALLAFLWPDAPAEAARNSLRVALANLRQALGPAAASLIADRQTVRLVPGGEGWLDVAAFRALLGTCKARSHEKREVCPDCVERLGQAVDLYGGDFLAGFSLLDATPFEEWALVCRAELHHHVLDALTTLAAAHEAAGDYGALCRRARRQLALEPWHEPAHRTLMRGLALTGDRSGALAHYDHCHAVLADELGVEPDAGTRALYERIRAGELAPATRDAGAPPYALPLPLTPFVGREAELATLRARADARLLTLVGAGGIGKTRLALELARAKLDAYVDGVFLIPLAPLDSADAIAPAIAAALHLTLRGDQMAALLRYLRDKRLLLILDNFEHLLDGVTLVTAILEAAPRVQIVATSRERLNVYGEQVYAVEGLEYRVGATLAEAMDMAAVRLFIQSAQLVHSTFALSEASLDPVLRICRLVQGMALGIELAAAWVDGLPPQEIAAAIERSAGFLEAEWRDVPGRHRSMRAVFDWSWRLLSAEEQQALCRLTVFRGGWTRETAEQVAGVSPRVLTRLVRKSLVRWSELPGTLGRYEMLEPLRQLAAERLGREAEAIMARHSEFYLRFVAAQERRLVREEPWAPTVAIGRLEVDNVRQAWAWAAAHARAELLDASVSAIGHYCWSGQLSASIQTYRLAAEALRPQIPSDGRPTQADQINRRTLAKLLAQAAAADIFQGQYARAYAEAQEAMAVGAETGGAEGEAYGTLVLAVAHLAGGMEGGQALIQRSLVLARAARERGETSEMLVHTEWSCFWWMAWDANRRGDVASARRWAGDGLEVGRQLATLRGELNCLEMLAVAEREAGDVAAARRYLEQMWELSRAQGHLYDEGVVRHGIGEVLVRQGRYGQARDSMIRALAAFRAASAADRQASALASLVRLYTTLGEVAQARAHLEQLDELIATGVVQYNAVQWELVRALLAERTGDVMQTIAAAERALVAARQTGQRQRQADALVVAGRAHERAERWESAEAAHTEALACYEGLGRTPLTAEPLAGLARVALARSQEDAALAQIEQVLEILAEHPWAGLDDPFALYYTCYRVLDMQRDPRAATVLQDAARLLHEYAADITDDSLRRSFLENVPTHRELLHAGTGVATVAFASPTA